MWLLQKELSITLFYAIVVYRQRILSSHRNPWKHYLSSKSVLVILDTLDLFMPSASCRLMFELCCLDLLLYDMYLLDFMYFN